MGKMKERSAWPKPGCCDAVHCLAGAECTLWKDRAVRLHLVKQMSAEIVSRVLKESHWSWKPMKRASLGRHTSCFFEAARCLKQYHLTVGQEQCSRPELLSRSPIDFLFMLSPWIMCCYLPSSCKVNLKALPLCNISKWKSTLIFCNVQRAS